MKKSKSPKAPATEPQRSTAKDMVGGGPRRRLTTPSLEAARCELTVNACDRFDLAWDILAPLVKENFPGAQVHALIF
jgi:hypothetical protein